MATLIRSRFRPEPRGRRIALTKRDVDLFRVLDRYRFLPANFLLHFLGGHPTYHRQRLTDLFHEGYLRKPPSQWEMFNARYRSNAYELAPKARGVLDDLAPPSAFRVGAGAPYWHEQLTCLVMASLELSAAREHVAMLSWRDVLAQAPARVRELAAPFAISIALPELPGPKRTLRPDALPFGLRGSRDLWFPGIEVDRHTEPLHPTDLRARSSSILLKFLLYRQFVRERLFHTHYGMPNVMVPIITVNDTHLANMIDLALSITDGRGFKWMLFRSLPALASVATSPEPQLDLLRTPWLRAGNDPIRLMEALDGA